MALYVEVNGRVLRSYLAPYVRNGRVVAPLEPYVTSIADSIGYSGPMMIVRRADRFVQILAPPLDPSQLNRTFVVLAPVLRTLGANVRYDAMRRALVVRIQARPLATPTPFNPAVPRAAPAIVFTPTPAPTPKPRVVGSPSPRRTPLPVELFTPKPR